MSNLDFNLVPGIRMRGRGNSRHSNGSSDRRRSAGTGKLAFNKVIIFAHVKIEYCLKSTQNKLLPKGLGTSLAKIYRFHCLLFTFRCELIWGKLI